MGEYIFQMVVNKKQLIPLLAWTYCTGVGHVGKHTLGKDLSARFKFALTMQNVTAQCLNDPSWLASPNLTLLWLFACHYQLYSNIYTSTKLSLCFLHVTSPMDVHPPLLSNVCCEISPHNSFHTLLTSNVMFLCPALQHIRGSRNEWLGFYVRFSSSNSLFPYFNVLRRCHVRLVGLLFHTSTHVELTQVWEGEMLSSINIGESLWGAYCGREVTICRQGWINITNGGGLLHINWYSEVKAQAVRWLQLQCRHCRWQEGIFLCGGCCRAINIEVSICSICLQSSSANVGERILRKIKKAKKRKEGSCVGIEV